MPRQTKLPPDAVPVQDFTQPPYRSDKLWYSHDTRCVYYVDEERGYVFLYDKLSRAHIRALTRAYEETYPDDATEYLDFLNYTKHTI